MDELKELHGSEADYTYKYLQLVNKRNTIDELAYLAKKKRDEDYARGLKTQILEAKDATSKLSSDKREGENSGYELAKSNLANSQEERFGNGKHTPEQQSIIDKEKENLESTHQDNLLAIDRAAEDEWAALDKASNALIFNKYQRERAEAQQTYADNLKGYKRLLDDKLKYSKDPVYRANAIALYNVQVTQAGEVKDNANTITDNQEYAEGQKLRDESRKGFADEKVKADSLKNTSIPKALNDKLGALQSQNESDVDAENEKFAAEGGNDKASEDEKKAHYDKLILLDKNYVDDKTSLKNAAFNKELDEAQKAEEALTNALAEGLAKRSEMQQASDQENIDTHSRLMGVQATLAQGRANSLASETADMERAEEQKKQDAIRAAKQQEAIALSQSFLNLLVALTKKGDNNAAVEAMAETLAAKGLAAVIAGSALEGVEDTGTLGSGGLDGKGGRPWMLHDNERVLTKEQNAALGDISNDDLVNSFNNIYNHQFQSANSTSGKNVTFTSEITSQLIPKLDMVVRAIESQPRQSVSLGKIGEWHETVVKDSQKIIIHHLRNGGRSKL